MKKGILIIALVFAGMGLFRTKMASAQATSFEHDIIQRIELDREARSNVFRNFANTKPPRAYQDEEAVQDEGDGNNFASICSAHPEAAPCRQALPQADECELECAGRAGLGYEECVTRCRVLNIR